MFQVYPDNGATVQFTPKISKNTIVFQVLKNGLPRLELNTHVQKIKIISAGNVMVGKFLIICIIYFTLMVYSLLGKAE